MDARSAPTTTCALPCAESFRSSLDALASLGLSERFLDELSDSERRALDEDWEAWARAEQWTDRADWTVWLMLGGRGSGKTRAGAEYMQALVNGRAPGRRATGQVAFVAETHADAREVMIEGESGLLAVARAHERPSWSPSRRRLEWPNGAVGHTFSSEDPDGLRGPQFAAAWCDELAKWTYPQETFDMLQFALRLGESPCQVVTTTPRNVPLLRRLLDAPRTLVSRMRTRDNERMLAPTFLDSVVRRYEGTRLGRQELDGELLEDRADALWSRAALERARGEAPPEFDRVVIAVDPPVTAGKRSDSCGIVVAARGGDLAFVLADLTLSGASPSAWAEVVCRANETYGADRIVVETNQGGDLVEEVMRTAAGRLGRVLPIRQVKATRSKRVRAEPVAALYERHLVRHCGAFPALEDEMCDFGPVDRGPGSAGGGWGLSSGRSPDRMDALVWALTDLMISRAGMPRARIL